jgi:hypothetical protein
MRLPLLSLLLALFASQCFANITITTVSLPNGSLSTAYAAVINASNGCTPYSWTITSGDLPPGIAMKPSATTTSLDLYGTPTTAGTYSFTVSAEGCGGQFSSVSYKVVVRSSYVNITTSSLPNGTVNTAYSAAINAGGGCTPYQWAIASGALPAGVIATVSRTTRSLNLAGTPTTAATDSLAVKVTGCGGHVSQVSYNVVIQTTANHVVDLNWNASTTSDVIGYNVYRGPDGATWNRINASLVGSTLYSDSTVANSTTYYYATTAVDSSGHESNMSASSKAAIP